jgi:hypothetical protein
MSLAVASTWVQVGKEGHVVESAGSLGQRILGPNLRLKYVCMNNFEQRCLFRSQRSANSFPSERVQMRAILTLVPPYPSLLVLPPHGDPSSHNHH